MCAPSFPTPTTWRPLEKSRDGSCYVTRSPIMAYYTHVLISSTEHKTHYINITVHFDFGYTRRLASEWKWLSNRSRVKVVTCEFSLNRPRVAHIVALEPEFSQDLHFIANTPLRTSRRLLCQMELRNHFCWWNEIEVSESTALLESIVSIVLSYRT